MEDNCDNTYSAPVTETFPGQASNPISRKRWKRAFVCLLLLALLIMICGLFGRMPFGPRLSEIIESIGVDDDPSVVYEKFKPYRESQRHQAFTVMSLGSVLCVVSVIGLLATRRKFAQTVTAPVTRRKFRFGLRSLFVMVTLFGIWLGWQVNIVHERKAILAEITRFDAKGAPFVYKTLEASEADPIESLEVREGIWERVRVSRIRRMLGDATVIRIFLPKSLDPSWIERAERAFPEAMLHLSDWDSERGGWSVTDSRDAILKPMGVKRVPNQGTVFKTGIIEESSESEANP